MRRPEFDQAVKDDAVVIIPVASTEQHGAHLPVNTDANIGFSIAKRAAEAIDDFPVLVLPAIWTGYSVEHTGYRGVITLKHQTFIDVLSQVAEGIYKSGFTKILFLNSHGGNNPAVGAMRMKLAHEDGFPPSVARTWFRLPTVMQLFEKLGTPRNDGHSGEFETSAQLYLDPELVDKGSLSWSEGVFGDPSNATKEKGEQFVTAAVKDLEEVLRAYRDGKLRDGWGWSEEKMVGRKEGQLIMF